MKVLYLTHLYPPEYIGGTENYTHALAKGLIELGHEARVLCVTDWERGEHYQNGETDDLFDGVPVRKLHLNWTKAPDVNRYLYDNPIVADYVGGYLSKLKPDLVHVTSCNTLSASVIRAVKQTGAPVVVTLTDFWFICPRVTLAKRDGASCDGNVSESECLQCLLRGSRAYQWARHIFPEKMIIQLLRAVSRHSNVTRLRHLRGMAIDIHDRRAKLHDALQHADRVLIASQSAKNLYQLNGFSMPIKVLPYGHDLSWLKQYRGKTPRNILSFGFIGQIGPMKGPHVLIDAYKNASQNGKCRLLIYGNMERNPKFSQQLRSLASGRNDIEFRGTYPHTESSKVFAEIDVLVVPSIWNDYPLIINEALATHTPVIATDLGGMSEFVQPEVNGLLFKRGSTDDLAQQLRRLIVDRELLARLQAGILPVKGIDEAVEEMLGIYQNVIDTKTLRKDSISHFVEDAVCG